MRLENWSDVWLWLFLHYQCVSVFSVLVDLVRMLNASFCYHKLLHMRATSRKQKVLGNMNMLKG